MPTLQEFEKWERDEAIWVAHPLEGIELIGEDTMTTEGLDHACIPVLKEYERLQESFYDHLQRRPTYPAEPITNNDYVEYDEAIDIWHEGLARIVYG